MGGDEARSNGRMPRATSVSRKNGSISAADARAPEMLSRASCAWVAPARRRAECPSRATLVRTRRPGSHRLRRPPSHPVACARSCRAFRRSTAIRPAAACSIGRHGGRIARQHLAHRGTPVIEAPERHEQQIEGRGPHDRSHGDEERRTKAACRLRKSRPARTSHATVTTAMSASRARTARGSTSTSGGAESSRHVARVPAIDGRLNPAAAQRGSHGEDHHAGPPPPPVTNLHVRRLFVPDRVKLRSLPPGITTAAVCESRIPMLGFEASVKCTYCQLKSL